MPTARRLLGGLDGDVAAGVAGADHQHPLAAQLRRVLVGRGVHDLAAELLKALVAGQLRRPVVAVGDHHGGVPGGAFGAVPAGGAGGHVPPVPLDGLDPDHLGAEPDVRTQVEVVGVPLEVGQQLTVVRVVRPGVRHREVGELGERLRRDQVGAGVHRAAVVPPVPGAADARLPLVAVHAEPVLTQVLDGRQAAGPGPDDADGVAPVGDRAAVAVRRGRGRLRVGPAVVGGGGHRGHLLLVRQACRSPRNPLHNRAGCPVLRRMRRRPSRVGGQSVAGSSRSTRTGKWSLARRVCGVSTTS
ncbi:hypothetical protein ONO86_03794 [Micromonospora noduli]|nr:hypothetical protein ONO86_03794 [Micromonospora noduli]